LTEEAVMNKSQELKQNAENCADLAATAKDERAKRRYERMEEAWNALAKTQAWLDGEKGQSHAEK
jgi:flagellar capping protein FliD